MNGADLFVRCLENEGVEYVFGVPGEENLDIMNSFRGSSITFITTRHEQGAAFMADVYGRLTGKAGVCLSTLGPGATNMITGVADANMDRAPIVAIAGQGATTRLHKESHQILRLSALFEGVSKYSTQIQAAETIPEIVRKAFKTAQAEKPGCAFIELPENIAAAAVSDQVPLRVNTPPLPTAPMSKCTQLAEIIAAAHQPLIIAGNGVVRRRAADALVRFAEAMNIPVATTFMAKGVIPFSHPLCLGAIGLQSRDHIGFGVEAADLIICIGYDLVEYHPQLWNPDRNKRILHIDCTPAEVDAHYVPEAGAIGDIRESLDRIAAVPVTANVSPIHGLRDVIVRDIAADDDDKGFPLKPQKIVSDLGKALDSRDIVVCDVGAHKIWTARMFRAESPNTCIISNGFAAMGIALPGAIAARLAHPERKVVALMGDGGFLMNCQEIETAVRLRLDIVILVFNDGKYGLIEWHQLRRLGQASHIAFGNPDLVKLAESFGARGYRVHGSDELPAVLKVALNDGGVSIIDCPVDSAENMRLTARLNQLASPFPAKGPANCGGVG
ncbi:MAG: acetolactate synthase large subunit [Alphaproteobacteria bacterium]